MGFSIYGMTASGNDFSDRPNIIQREGYEEAMDKLYS